MPSFCIIPASNLMLCSTIGPLYFSITSRAAPRQSSHASAHPCRASPNWIVRILSRTSDKPVVSVSTPITGLRSPSQRRNSSNSSRLSTSVSWMLSNDASSSALAKIVLVGCRLDYFLWHIISWYIGGGMDRPRSSVRHVFFTVRAGTARLPQTEGGRRGRDGVPHPPRVCTPLAPPPPRSLSSMVLVVSSRAALAST